MEQEEKSFVEEWSEAFGAFGEECQIKSEKLNLVYGFLVFAAMNGKRLDDGDKFTELIGLASDLVEISEQEVREFMAKKIAPLYGSFLMMDRKSLAKNSTDASGVER